MPSPVIDLETIETLKSLNPDDNGEFLREIIQIFLEDTPARIAELDLTTTTGDAPKFIRAAHSIKGSSANMGALALRDVAEKLEHYAKTNGVAGSGSLLADLKSAYAEAEVAIKQFLPA